MTILFMNISCSNTSNGKFYVFTKSVECIVECIATCMFIVHYCIMCLVVLKR